MLQKGSEVSGQDRLLGFAQTQCVEEKNAKSSKNGFFNICRISDIQTTTETMEYLIDHTHFNWHNYINESNYANILKILFCKNNTKLLLLTTLN